MNLNHICKRAWRIRAQTMNQQKLVGKINKIPVLIQKENVLKLLCNDLEHNYLWFCNYLQRGMVSNWRSKDSNCYVCIGNEHVRFKHYLYVDFYVIPLLLVTLFGKRCSNAESHIVSCTANRTILHFWSAYVLELVLTFANNYVSKNYIDTHIH